MTDTPMLLTPSYDSASRVDIAHPLRHLKEPGEFYFAHPRLPFNYAGLLPLLAGQNSSANITFLITDLFEMQGLDGGITGGWGLPPRVNRAFGIVTDSRFARPRRLHSAQRISLADAHRLAVTALQEAEKRRQAEREREAIFWASLED